jgi:superfamily II DNA or RNA helicase
MHLRPYQQKMLDDARAALGRGAQSVCIQAPTGSGKTVLFCEITRLANELGNTIWVIVPRNELLEQSSETLTRFGVAHGRIAVGSNESRAFKTHVVSKDTLIRRLAADKIKNAPDIIIVDEAHLALTRYLELRKAFPGATFIGFTATPERLDGRGLSELYDELIAGPTIKELVEMEYLTNVRYFRPPSFDMTDLHRRGTEVISGELEKILTNRRIYGDAVKHYKAYADGKPALIFCRSIKSANEAAQNFSTEGYLIENIDGTMSYRKRKALIDALKNGTIQGLTSCELVTYGLDVPRVECIIMLRPTMSRTLFFQMIGRGLRPCPGKTECTVLDHVGNLQYHGHPLADYRWNFHGVEKIKREKDKNIELRLCAEIGFMYCGKASCAGCEYNTTGKTERKLAYVETDLVEVASIPLAQRPYGERKDINDRISRSINLYRDGNDKDSISELLNIAKSLGNDPMWVYWQLSEDRRSIDVPLLYNIAKQKGYKPGWAYHKKQIVARKLGRH